MGRSRRRGWRVLRFGGVPALRRSEGPCRRSRRYSLDEYYARNLGGYYRALAVGSSHNCYEGRAAADLTGFVEFFCAGMADAFAAVRAQAVRASARGARDATPNLRRLDPRQRRLLELLRARGVVTSSEIAGHLQLSREP